MRKVFGTGIKWFLEYIISEKIKVQKNSLLSKKNKGNYICVHTYLYPHMFIMKQIKQIQSTKMEKI